MMTRSVPLRFFLCVTLAAAAAAAPAINSADVEQLSNDIDYYFVAHPAATAKQ